MREKKDLAKGVEVPHRTRMACLGQTQISKKSQRMDFAGDLKGTCLEMALVEVKQRQTAWLSCLVLSVENVHIHVMDPEQLCEAALRVLRIQLSQILGRTAPLGASEILQSLAGKSGLFLWTLPQLSCGEPAIRVLVPATRTLLVLTPRLLHFIKSHIQLDM